MKQGILTHFLLSFVLALSGAIATAHPSTSSSAVVINKCLSSPYQTKSSSTHYPAGYAMSASDAHSVFLYADSYGDDLSMRKGAFVTQVSSKTLKPIWYNRLIDSRAFDAWEYPGNLNVSGNFLYVNHALHLYQIDPKTGKIVKMLELPTGAAAAQDTSYYGFIAASSNTIILKSVSRPAGCAIPGPRALVDCRASTISPSILLAVDTNSMTITDQITLPAVPTSKPTLAYFNGGKYIYIPQGKTIVRYQLNGQHFALDTTWNPGNILLPGQTMPAACSILNDWVVVQTNGAPSASPSSLIIINQNNAAQQNSLQPFAHDILPLLSAKKFATTAAGQPAVSWVPTSATVDSASNTIYISDAVVGRIAAVQLIDSVFNIIWRKNQITTEPLILIGSSSNKSLVSTMIPIYETPRDNRDNYIVWLYAQTGKELQRSALLPNITPQAMIKATPDGQLFYPGYSGELIKLTPTC